MWHAQGAPYYLKRQVLRMKSTQILADKAAHIPQIVQIARLLGQLCGRYYAAKRSTVDGLPLFPKGVFDGIKGTLGECEKELEELHMAAACAEEMLADAYFGLEIEPPVRPFTIIADSDVTAVVAPLEADPPKRAKENGKR